MACNLIFISLAAAAAVGTTIRKTSTSASAIASKQEPTAGEVGWGKEVGC